MTTDTWTAEVLDEAERIVRAEWLRLLTGAAPGHLAAARTELPVARPRSATLALRSAEPQRRGARPPGARRNRPATRGRNSRVWPTQRSPPSTDAQVDPVVPPPSRSPRRRGLPAPAEVAAQR